jgi:hypothetical protein
LKQLLALKMRWVSFGGKKSIHWKGVMATFYGEFLQAGGKAVYWLVEHCPKSERFDSRRKIGNEFVVVVSKGESMQFRKVYNSLESSSQSIDSTHMCVMLKNK